MTTALTAIFASLVGGSLGALITAMLQSKHEREQQLRERMLAAADDFATGALQANLIIRDAVLYPKGANPRDHLLSHRAEVANRVDAAHARLARVKLLFGDDTPAGRSSLGTVDALARARFAIDELDHSKANKEIPRILNALATFTEDARRTIEGERERLGAEWILRSPIARRKRPKPKSLNG